METYRLWLDQTFLDNSLGNWLLFVAILAGGLLFRTMFTSGISRLFYSFVRTEAGSVPLSDFFRLVQRPLEWLVVLLAIYLAFHRLSVPTSWGWAPVERFGIRLVGQRLYGTIVMLTLIFLAIRLVKFVGLIFMRRAEQTESRLDDQLVPFFRDLAIVFVTLAGSFATLGLVFNVNVVGLVTGLGIGGLAIALAARETLENLFASFAILLDRPFVSGDSVTAGTGPNQVTGTVERIGFRSTRLRTDDGSLIAVPNRLMVSQTLDNLSQRSHRRAKFWLRLALDTPAETLQAIIEAIRMQLELHPLTREQKALVQFDGIGESSLDILVQYYVATADWHEFNRIKEEVNYLLVEIVQKHKGELAQPSRVLHLRQRLDHPLES